MKEFAWDLGYDCNFKCEYCFFTRTGWENIRKQHGRDRTVEEIDAAWKRIYNKYGQSRIRITGGEPFLYTGFPDIVAKISKYHFMHITTNLSSPLEEIISKSDPSDVEFNATFHPMRIDAQKFANQVLKLKKAGFTCGACHLAHPMQIRELLNYKRYFKSLGIDMAITLFNGEYLGKIYPEAYSDDERQYFNYAERWDNEKTEMNELRRLRIMHFPRETGSPQKNVDPYTGETIQCGAGKDYAVVGVDGSVKPCARLDGPILGNIYKGDVVLLNEYIDCKNQKCARGINE